MAGVVLLAAGGTGGHLFPAESLAVALKKRGWRVYLATDHRVEAYGQDFPAEEIHIVPSATITRSPVAAITAVCRLGLGFLKARGVIKAVSPTVAIGFGGYPTIPPILAAWSSGLPTIVHEQNAVLGRANRLLGKRATAIATSFASVDASGGLRARMVETGNPVRPAVRSAASTAYPVRTVDEPFRLLVFGGSQGARFMSDLVPLALALMSESLRSRLKVTQQCRPEDIARVAESYRDTGIDAELEPFFRDLPDRIAASHLVVCRAGASTVAELAVIGRPAIMVPLPHALDQDQKANAKILDGAGGGWMVEQDEMTPDRLARDLTEKLENPERLTAAAVAAGAMGRPHAVETLADLVEKVAAHESLAGMRGQIA